MNDQSATMGDRPYPSMPKMEPRSRDTARPRKRRMFGKRWLTSAVRPLAVPAILVLLLFGSLSIPLPSHAASLGANGREQITAGSLVVQPEATIAKTQFAASRISFTGDLSSTIGRTTVSIEIQQVNNESGTHGSMRTLATRVFNTQPASLPSLFTSMGVTAQPGATYTIAVVAGGKTLTSETITLGRS